MSLRVGVWGGAGRLGSVVSRALKDDGQLPVAIGREQAPLTPVNVVIDASGRDALTAVVHYCRTGRVPLIECVSDLSETDLQELLALANLIPVIRATNLTFGHHLQLTALKAVAGAAVRGGVPVECVIVERHPATKADRPSASALELSSLWTQVSGLPATDVAAVRGGRPVSDHAVIVSAAGSDIEILHSETDLAAAASGAVLAAKWITDRPHGAYSMSDVFANGGVEARTREKGITDDEFTAQSAW